MNFASVLSTAALTVSMFLLSSITCSAQASEIRSTGTDPVSRLINEAKADKAHREAVSDEVEKLFRDDQAEGSPDQMPEAQRRAWEAAHEKRVIRMREIVRTERLETIPDLYNAGLLLHHGIAPEDFLTAHVLFTTAALKGSTSAKWAAAAALDRYLGWTGKPFLFSVRPGQPNLIADELREFYCMKPPSEEKDDSYSRPEGECAMTARDLYNNRVRN